MERALNVAEAAAYLNLRPAYIYKLISQKKLPCYRPMGGRVYFRVSELEAWLFRNRQAADYETTGGQK